jgi:hypothetical protein
MGFEASRDWRPSSCMPSPIGGVWRSTHCFDGVTSAFGVRRLVTAFGRRLVAIARRSRPQPGVRPGPVAQARGRRASAARWPQPKWAASRLPLRRPVRLQPNGHAAKTMLASHSRRQLCSPVQLAWRVRASSMEVFPIHGRFKSMRKSLCSLRSLRLARGFAGIALASLLGSAFGSPPSGFGSPCGSEDQTVAESGCTQGAR